MVSLRGYQMSDLYISCEMIRDMRPDSILPMCCSSCHDDEDELGLDMCSVEGPGFELGEHTGGVCCNIANYLEANPLTEKEVEKIRTLPCNAL